MSTEIQFFSNILELFLNIIELTAVIGSILTFFYLMLNQYSKALNVILSPCGITLHAKLKALFFCRNSPLKKRAFIEFALLRTKGCPIIASEWILVVNEFKSFFTASSAEPLYSIPNCTLLIGEEFSASTERYFRFFSNPRVRAAFGVHDNCMRWVTRIHITEAYVTPTCLITGLLSKYQENWNEFIKKYVSTAYMFESLENTQGSILSNELYLTFAWLLWGPSYEIDFENYWAGLCQISYGDESNSIPAVAKKERNISHKMVQKLLESRDQQYGMLVSSDIFLYENKAYFKEISDTTNPENTYFYNKIQSSASSFAAQIEDFAVNESFKSKKYYCTAYVWILFVLEDDTSYSFRPEKSVAFFEHANLTDKSTYSFLVSTLIDKSIRHFYNIFSNPSYNGRKYRFICAMNKEIERCCVSKYEELISSDSDISHHFKDRIIMKPKHRPADVFASYDEFFSQNGNLFFEEVVLSDKKSITNLGRYYTDIYMECFPDANERETFDNLLTYLRQAGASNEYRYHIVLAKDAEDTILGGGIFDYFIRSNTGFIEYIAVKNDSQSSGIGTLIYNHILSILARDSHECRGELLNYVFCEIDAPEYSQASIKKYLYFWNRHNFMHLDFSYIQPALSEAQESVCGLWLTVSPLRGMAKTIPGALVAEVVHDYMKFAMQISNPRNNGIYKAMVDDLQQRKDVPLLRIINEHNSAQLPREPMATYLKG